MKRKIAIFQKNLSLGGIQRSLINLLNSIDCTKYDIDLYLFSEDKFYSDIIPKSINVIYLKKMNKLSKLLPFVLLQKYYKSKIEKEYDVAIDYDGYSNDTALAMINCKASRKIMWLHQDFKERMKKDYKYRILYFLSSRKYKYVNQFVAVSKGVKDSFNELQKKNLDIMVIPNIILSEKIINQSKEKTSFTVDSKKLNIVTMGRLCYQKGFDILIKYMREILNQRSDANLYIIGSGPDETKLKKLIKKYNLTENVNLLGAQKNPFNIMKLMDLFVLTSRHEGQGMVILETKVLGLPICISKNLEKYNEGIKGSTNFVKDVVEFKKVKSKKIDDLKSYNNNIVESVYHIFD